MSLLHVRPETDVTYAGDTVAGVPIFPPPGSLKIVLGHLPDNPRRLVKAFVDHVRAYFASDDVKRLLVVSHKKQ